MIWWTFFLDVRFAINSLVADEKIFVKENIDENDDDGR